MNEIKLLKEDRHPNVAKLRERFHNLQTDGLKDIKFWYVGDTGFNGTDGPTVDDLSAEVISILDAYQRQDFIDISEKVK